MQRAQALLAAALLLLGCAAPEEPPGHPEVLVVVNGASEISVAIGRYYAARRGVPDVNVLALELPVKDSTLTTRRHQTTSRLDFERLVRDPIAAFLTERDTAGVIRVIVTTKGVPLRITGAAEEEGRPFEEQTAASVDAELALLFSGRDGSPGTHSVVNPYYGSDLPFEQWRQRHLEAPLHYLVARLTGYQTGPDPETGVPADVKRLIDAAFSDSAPGP